MINEINQVLDAVSSFLWGPFALAPILAVAAITFTVANKFIQIRQFGHAVMLTAGKYDDPNEPGTLTHFKALSTALSATVGLGNIAGVAIAIRRGGPGAMFWMWMTGFFGMATKYCCCMLAVKYRKIDPDGNVRGGPMYTIENGLGMKWKPMAVFFSIAVVLSSFGMANLFQNNQVASEFYRTLHIPPVATGVILAFLTYLVIIGGIKRIGEVAGYIVPFMCGIYVIGAMTILFLNYEKVPAALSLIISSAFNGHAAIGGFQGATVWFCLSWGVRRGIFSNEAGLGSAPIAHATAKTNEPVREGIVALLEPFIDTIVVCSMTALVIVITGMWQTDLMDAAGNPLTGATLASEAFAVGLNEVGRYIVTIAIFFFAYSTTLSWSYYGEKGVEYLGGKKWLPPYRYFFVFLVFVGAAMAQYQGASWFLAIINLSDSFNALMAFPNLVSLFLLLPVIMKTTNDYIDRRKKGILP